MSAPSIDRGTAGVAIQGTVLSVIVPTRNEAGNVAALVTRLDAALDLLDAEIVFVDDSDDDTADADPLRGRRRRSAGCGSSTEPQPTAPVGWVARCWQGFARREATWAVVMDGDLQHPPETVPQLLRVGVRARRRPRGRQPLPRLRRRRRPVLRRPPMRLRSAGPGVTRTAFPRRLATCTDPMSGFFAVRRGAVDLDTLRPRGFKILLEIAGALTRGSRRGGAVHLQERLSGQSKASVREGALFLRQLLSLRASSWWRPVGADRRRALSASPAGRGDRASW